MITIEVFQATEEEDGSYTASLNFIESTNGKIVKKQNVSARNLNQFKDRIRVYKTRIETLNTRKINILAIVQQAIDEVMEE